MSTAAVPSIPATWRLPFTSVSVLLMPNPLRSSAAPPKFWVCPMLAADESSELVAVTLLSSEGLSFSTSPISN